MEIANKCWSQDKLSAMREQVLQTWPTGQEVDLEDAVKYQQALPEAKRLSRILAAAMEQERTLVQPRAGVALIEEHIELLRYLEMEGADCLPTTIDSCTAAGAEMRKYPEKTDRKSVV